VIEVIRLDCKNGSAHRVSSMETMNRRVCVCVCLVDLADEVTYSMMRTSERRLGVLIREDFISNRSRI
jgi:hypothetical protein